MKIFDYRFVLLDELKQVGARAVLENDPEMVPGLVPVVELEDVGMVEVVEDPQLVSVSRVVGCGLPH